MNDFDKKGFKLIDCYTPTLNEGDYEIEFKQAVTVNQQKVESFKKNKKIQIKANSIRLTDDAIFNVQPAPNQRGDFSTELPYMVINDPSFPWIKELTITKDNKTIPLLDDNGNPIPWLALVVISEKEVYEEKDVKYANLKNETGEKIQIGDEIKSVYFDYEECPSCKEDDLVHLVTVREKIFESIIPTESERAWLTHCKRVDLSHTDDVTAQNDGYFSVVIANRFPPCNDNQIITSSSNGNDDVKRIKNTVHLIAAHLYDAKDKRDLNQEIKNYDFVKMISLYHWNIYSDIKEIADKSFETIINDMTDKNNPSKRKSLTESALKEHYLRSGEKTYSWYHSPIQPMKYERPKDVALNGEKTYTSDGRLIYDFKTGIFDITYAAAFNLGRMATLSHNAEAQKIVKWRKEQKIDKHLNALKDLDNGIGIDYSALNGVVKKLKEGQLK